MLNWTRPAKKIFCRTIKKIWAWKVGWIKHQKKSFSQYLRISFKCVWPNVFSPECVKNMSLQSWMVITPKSLTTTTTVIWHFLTKIPILICFFFWLKSSSYNIIWPKNLIFWISVSFFLPPPSGPEFWPIWHPCPHPMGHHPHPPAPQPSYMFLLPDESTKCAYSSKTG